MTQHEELMQKIRQFSIDRDWDKYHKSKDLAIAANIEAGELLEHFLWKTDEEFEEYFLNHKENVSDELADVLIYLFELAHKLDIDIYTAIETKIAKNEIKYPIEKCKGIDSKNFKDQV